MRLLLLMFFFSLSISVLGQHRIPAVFGKPTFEEINMKAYPQDIEAAGVVLFDKGNYKVEEINGQMKLVKEVHKKIKVLDAKNFKNGEVEIIYYKGENSTEKVTEIKAITHLDGAKKYLSTSAIFTTDLTPNWKSKKFTFPDIKDGSVLEFTYRIESPYFFNLGGWYFQSDLPTIYSEFYSEIPGNFRYNKATFGTQPLVIKEIKLKNNCFTLSYANTNASCETNLFTMEHIPAFKEEEYMLSKDNYIARISYELSEYENLIGEKKRYSKTWKDVEKELKFDKDLGRQLKSSKFFEKNIPTQLLAMPVNKEKAIEIYNFIRDHFIWNKELSNFSNIEVKDAFNNKKGNSSEINLALINALKAGGFESHMVLSSTRANGLPTPFYPVISDFNYVFVALVLDSETILLDATRKNAPFGLIPFELLNEQGRLMDFKNESKWISIEPFKNNAHVAQIQLKADENGLFIGKGRETYLGYLAFDERSKIENTSKTSYLKDKETIDLNTEVSSYSINNAFNADENFELNYNISLETEIVGDKHLLNPFFFENIFKKNPFILKERSYPVDFGHPYKMAYSLSFDLSDQYTVIELPKDVSIGLPDNKGSVVVKSIQTENNIQLRYSLKLEETRFNPEDYDALKQFFELVIKTQTQSALILKKRE